MPREGSGREILGLYSRESRETGIPAHPWFSLGQNIKLRYQSMHAGYLYSYQNLQNMTTLNICTPHLNMRNIERQILN